LDKKEKLFFAITLGVSLFGIALMFVLIVYAIIWLASHL